MAKVYALQVRLTRDEYERVQQRAVAKGFRTLSSYIRYAALDQDFDAHEKIHELHRFLLPPSDGKK